MRSDFSLKNKYDFEAENRKHVQALQNALVCFELGFNVEEKLQIYEHIRFRIESRPRSLKTR